MDLKTFILLKGLPSVPKELQKNSEKENTALQMLRAKYANYHFKDTFSWVDQGVVTSVKNQGQCGSCAAFAAGSIIETCLKVSAGGKLNAYDISEQHLIDCAYHKPNANEGASGTYT